MKKQTKQDQDVYVASNLSLRLFLSHFSLQKGRKHRFLSQEPFKRYCLSAYLSKTKPELFKES